MGKSAKKKGKKLTGRSVLLCLFLVFAVYMGVNLVLNSGGSMTTYMAREGEISESFTIDGYIFKDQTVINSPKDGYLECITEESGRIGKGGIVAYIYDNEAPIKEKNRIKEIDKKIKELKEDDRSMSASENDSVRLEQDILKEVVKIFPYVRDKDIESIKTVRKNLDHIVEARQKISGEDRNNQEEINALEREKAELERKFNMSKTAVFAPVAGSFTARVDGYEDTLDDSKLKSITRSYLKEIKTNEKNKESGAKIKEGEAVGKIVDTYTWYLAAVVDKDIVETLSVGDSVRLKFLDSSDNMINGSVYNITDDSEKDAVLVIKSAGYVDNLYSMSEAKVEIVKSTYEGIKIPAKSIRVKDERKGVYILSGDKIKFRDAKIYYMDDEWAVISREEENGLKLYDSVVVSGSNIYEGKVVR